MARIGTLYLIPCALHESNTQVLLPTYLHILIDLRLFIVENIRTTRRFFKAVIPVMDIDACKFIEIDKHNPDQKFDEVWGKLLVGEDVGLLSESGCPAIADPGSKIVAEAHLRSIIVKPWIGPSSIILALMASGFNGQGFSFHGYLPSRSISDLTKKIIQLEADSRRSGITQLFIETPYRNASLLKSLVTYLKPTTMIGVAIDLTGLDEKIIVKSVTHWKKHDLPDFQKHPAIFLIHSGNIA